MSAHAASSHLHDAHSHTDLSHHPALRESNISLSGAGSLSGLLLALAIGGVGVTIAGALVGPGGLHAKASFQAAAMGGLAICLGGMFFTLVMHLVAAGWSVPLRRQMENLAFFTPVMLLVASIVPILDFVQGGRLYLWMSEGYATSYLLEKKRSFFFGGKESTVPVFFFLRLMIYLLVWSLIAYRLAGLSRQQDLTGDKWLTNKARFTSAWGMLLFALTTAFAAFDLLMSIDFRFFSTMWGVYYFAGAAFSAAASVVLITALLRRAGKLEGLVTPEHFHDAGKLMFSFTVFWAYIAFSQYFLIWYANLPEETAWYLVRKQDGWQFFFYLLCFGHFIAPFLVLIFRGVKRSHNALILVALWMLFIHFVDMFWIVRPMVTTREGAESISAFTGLWVDAAAMLGVLGFLGFLVARRVAAVPLIPTKDPRLSEALHHKNYV